MKRILRYLINKIRGRDSLETLMNLGLTVGKNFYMQQECIIDSSFCHLIFIGDDCTLAPRVHILAHDASTKRHLGYPSVSE